MPNSSTTPSPRTRKPKPSPAEPDWHKILHEARQRFGIRRFRPGQREVLAHVLAGHDTLALMPTGAGKSLTYQLPSLFLPKPVVVVSPLIALMQDQQDKAAEADIHVESLNSTLRKSEADTAREEIDTGIAQLIYCTPERLQTAEFREELKAAGGISLLVVDEAHCIAQWGHDFRPAYLAIGEARRALGNPPVLALTATATEEVKQEILASLHAESAAIVDIGTERTNLFFAVHPTVNIQAKFARIEYMLRDQQGTGIIYTASVHSANELFDYLTERGISVGHYHGKMGVRDRERVQQEFMRGEHKVMIATKAFGLGIDKPDIRFVFHFEFPDSLETYYQEAGRGGRDGAPAHAVLLYRLEDKRIQSFFLAGRYPKAEELRHVYSTLADVTQPRPAQDPAAPDSSDVSFRSEAEESAVPDAAESSTAPSRQKQPVPADLTPTPENLARLSGVGRRRTQVILNLLTQAGLVRRGRRGYTLVPHKQHPTDESLDQLLQTYIDRAARDKERLTEMMHYAETPNCRVQVVRAYFNEDEAEPCLRCDNCAREFPDQVAPELEPILTRGRRKPPTSAPAPPEPETAHPVHEEVTTVHTAFGEIQTTAPETLLHPEAEPVFHKGDKVLHKRFGHGSVLDILNDLVLVDFVKGGSKRLRADFLEAA